MASRPSELFVVVPLSALCDGGESDAIAHRPMTPAEDAEPTWEDAEWL